MTPVILRLFYRCQWAVGSLGFYWGFFLHPPHFPLWSEFGRLSRTGVMLQALTFRGERGRARQRGKRERERERCHWQLQGNALHEC